MPTAGPRGIVVRRASTRDHLGVMRVLDGANLELPSETAQRRIDAGTVVVADDDNRIVGALVAVGREQGVHIEAIAVRRRRRADGIGTALVEHAAGKWTPLTADFDRSVKPFYDSLGFDCEKRGDRYRGILD
ncbi:GNAT family N-acetyltransferase [Halobacterium sp. KA-4]|uniref:GNAT family N-acetyltransferase n=1 Tax=Halobacterium sp. KA-4 TaxID=2896367 RepID=UPI003FA560E6